MSTTEIIQRHDRRSILDVLSDVSRDDNLMKRLATIRNVVPGRIVFTTSFGIEDQAIGHAIFAQDLDVDVVTLYRAVISGDLRTVVADGTSLRHANPGILSRPHEC